MAWLVVMFDLPVKTRKQRKAANGFRVKLLQDGYFQMQFSVYARPCGSPALATKHKSRVRAIVPGQGEVRIFQITDTQWKRVKVFRGRKPVPGEDMPEQLVFF